MENNIYIYGAGMSGLLAARMFSKFTDSKKITIREAKDDLPNNHAALLRFRGIKVQTNSGINLKRVNVNKAFVDDKGFLSFGNPSIKDMNAYSLLVSDKVSSRSIFSMEQSQERFIAPKNFISRLFGDITIERKIKVEFSCYCYVSK